jgi:LmbE family N-acetylglucosaminyl deacetylase
MSGDIHTVGLMVAHPDDETLWAGGLLLAHPEWRVWIATLCRAGDPDREPRFFSMLARLGANGVMADLDDGPEQAPLDDAAVRAMILTMMNGYQFDVLLTHGPRGEYTRHRRHEEVSGAVTALWMAGVIRARELWLFAYDDAGGTALPRARPDAHRRVTLPPPILAEKRCLIIEQYGFAPTSWEGRTIPAEEAFWCFSEPAALREWLAHYPTSDSPHLTSEGLP